MSRRVTHAGLLMPWARELQREAPEFVDLGRDHHELDCWGLVCLAYRELLSMGLPGYEDEYDDIAGDPDTIKELFLSGHEEWLEIPEAQAGPFDLVNLRLRGRPIHVALIVTHDKMVHTMEGVGVTIEGWNDRAWKDRKIGFFRHPDLA